VTQSGLVQPLGRDAGGHIQKRIDRGEVHELTLGEKQAFWRGEAS
jgi:hypothetical protein